MMVFKSSFIVVILIIETLYADTQLSSEGFSNQRSYIEFGSFIGYFATIYSNCAITLCLLILILHFKSLILHGNPTILKKIEIRYDLWLLTRERLCAYTTFVYWLIASHPIMYANSKNCLMD